MSNLCEAHLYGHIGIMVDIGRGILVETKATHRAVCRLEDGGREKILCAGRRDNSTIIILFDDAILRYRVLVTLRQSSVSHIPNNTQTEQDSPSWPS